MADGDAAAAAGMDTVAGTDDLRDSYNQHNKTRDYLAQHQTAGTHSASQITSGVFDAARIPTPASLKSGTGTCVWDGAAWIMTGNVGVSGYMNVSGALTVSGILTAIDAYNRSVAGGGGYRATYTRADGIIGYVPSARRLKKNIKQADAAQLAKLLEAPVVEFDYKAAAGGGHDVGLIADDLHDLGLGAFVFYEPDGQVAGIHYERLTVPLLAIVQQLAHRLDQLEQKIEGGV